MINYKCKGTIKFPDGGVFSIRYKEEEYQVVLGEKETGEIWYKGKEVTVCVLF